MEMNLKKVLAAGVAMALSAAAMADTTTDPGVTAITGLQTTATAYISAAFAVAVLVAGGFWGIRFMKKAFSAAA